MALEFTVVPVELLRKTSYPICTALEFLMLGSCSGFFLISDSSHLQGILRRFSELPHPLHVNSRSQRHQMVIPLFSSTAHYSLSFLFNSFFSVRSSKKHKSPFILLATNRHPLPTSAFIRDSCY